MQYEYARFTLLDVQYHDIVGAVILHLKLATLHVIIVHLSL